MRRPLSLLALAAGISVPAGAQQNNVTFATGVVLPGTFLNGVPSAELGFMVAPAGTGTVGFGLGLTTLLDPAVHGSFNVMTDLDAVSVEDTRGGPHVFLRGGATALVMRGMALGLNGGVGVGVPLGRRTWARLDYTYRLFLSLGGARMSSVTLGFGIDY